MKDHVIEAAAKALCRSRYLGAIEWERLQPHEQVDFRQDAREALLAAEEARFVEIERIIDGRLA